MMQFAELREKDGSRSHQRDDAQVLRPLGAQRAPGLDDCGHDHLFGKSILQPRSQSPFSVLIVHPSRFSSQDSTETASGVVTKWVRVADKCLSFNNYNAIVQIITALQIPDIQKVIWTVRLHGAK